MHRATHDAEAGATYIYIIEGEKITRTETVHEDGQNLINLDFAGDKLVGVEVVSVKSMEDICDDYKTDDEIQSVTAKVHDNHGEA
jgi:uncharacterized protein YuzE